MRDKCPASGSVAQKGEPQSKIRNSKVFRILIGYDFIVFARLSSDLKNMKKFEEAVQ